MSISIGFGQVKTIFYPNKDALRQNSLLRITRQKTTNVKVMPPLDARKIAALQRQDRDGSAPFHFGEGFDTHLTLTDGEWMDVENGRLWTMTFVSEGAYSINFVFADFHLPDNAKLYIANEDGDMLYGPVTSKATTEDGSFLTDLIKGDRVTIYLFEPSDKKGMSKLTIKRVIHAFVNLFGNPLRSLGCHEDIACHPAWKRESDAIALVLLANGKELCSGSLLMTADQSFRPRFLTVFHCIDDDRDGKLSDSEISHAKNWMFKFQYKMTSCGGDNVTSGISYNGADYMAAWNKTDFALMELKEEVSRNPDLSWLGWDRRGNIPTSGTGIHHPSGDVMKISFDYNRLRSNTQNDVNYPVNTHWVVKFKKGTVEGGSSGSPLLDENKRVVGQLHSAKSVCTHDEPRFYGQFHRSWIGGGANSTGLRHWLDPHNTGAMMTNTSKSPIISGPTTVLNQETYTIQNMPSGSSVRWSTNNGNLQLVSGQGTKTVVFRKNGSGECVIQATIRPSNLTVIHRVCALPSRPTRIDGIRNGQQFGPGSIVSFSINDVGDANSITWDVYGGRIYSGQGTRSISVEVATKSGPFNVHVTKRNNCGSISFSEIGAINPNAAVQSISLSPNPATDVVTLKLTEWDDGILSPQGQGSLTTKGVTSTYEIQLWNGLTMLKSFKTNQPTFQIPIAGLPAGLYFVRVIKDGQTYTAKLIKN